MPEPVQIIMGIHPHPRWRSFKTSEDVATHELRPPGDVLYIGGLRLPRYYLEEVCTEFGLRLVDVLTLYYPPAEQIARIRFRQRQFELCVVDAKEWDEVLPTILKFIAGAHSETMEHELEIRDMSGPEGPTVDTELFEELEEIKEFSDSFVRK